MANEMPPPEQFTGLSRRVIDYSVAFQNLMAKAKSGHVADTDWAEFEGIVDAATWQRMGVFTGAAAEMYDWAKYKAVVAQFGGMAEWEGTLRNITEVGNRVFLELEERNTFNGETDVSNTMTIYDFDDAGRMVHLDVYIMPLRKQPPST